MRSSAILSIRHALLLLSGMMLLPSRNASGQSIVDVEIAAPNGTSKQSVLVVGSAKTLYVGPSAKEIDTLKLVTPAQLLVDLAAGDVIVSSADSSWMSVKVKMSNGSVITSTARRLKIARVGNKIEVRGLPALPPDLIP